jgi:predicted  nucleic acid-binding Zn-ribbon protein/SAM-dependent methyltransferase
MIPVAPSRHGMHPSIVLSAYVEPLVRGRRVAILGDASIGLADELSQRGARLVHVYDPDTARTAEALARAAPGKPHQVAYAVLAGDLGVRDGAFDVVVVPDLALFADPADTMRRARRLCSPAGVAVFVAPNAGAPARRLLGAARAPIPGSAPAPLGYYELYDLVSLQFAKVRMIGQAPFVGYTVADFTQRGEPEVSVDTSLLASSEEPEYFIALASERPVSLDAYSVIGLPWQDLADALAPSEPVTEPADRAADRIALADAEARIALLTGELTKVREQAAEAASRAPVAAALSARVAELESEVAANTTKLREVEGRAGDNHVRAERLTSQIRDLDEELRRQRDRGTKLSKLLDDEKKARTKAEVELGMLRGAPAAPPAPAAKDRVDALTAELAASEAREASLAAALAQSEARVAALSAERSQAEARIASLGTELSATHARIADLEMSIVETRRRPAAEPNLLARLAELESMLQAAHRDATQAEGERDVALARAAKAESMLERSSTLETSVVAEREEKAALASRIEAMGAQIADLERRLAAERDRAAAASRSAADGVRRVAEIEREAGDAASRASKLAHTLSEAEKKVAELEARVADRDQRLGDLAERHAAELAKAMEAGIDRAAVDAAQAELDALEAQLLERGRTIAALNRDLRESERIGRELLSDLTAARTPNGAGPSGEELKGRLDALAQSAARGEADLTAAQWRIAQLERELAGVHDVATHPSRAQQELEDALAAARDEVAALRKALSETQA